MYRLLKNLQKNICNRLKGFVEFAKVFREQVVLAEK